SLEPVDLVFDAAGGDAAERSAPLVRPGGRLVYVVCSLLDAEGADQVAGFLGRHPAWRAVVPPLGAGERRGDGLRLTAQFDECDGFFVARLERS
ncbi:MAG TPA: hypothetical protein VN627_11685, partial [Novosphingobium sp.]|nr:hypothetical protein [Novosphingobium sp.]